MADERKPTFGSLFAGIGGIDLGLERAGWKCRWQVEWDAYCQRVLAKHWPDVPRYGDITTVDWSGVEPVDLIAGGFPCQPFSVAGRRRGTDDDRWLWPEFARAVRALQPRFVLVENVPGLLAGGGMGSVLGALAASGYDAEWDSIPAAAVGAPHLRYRVWIVAHRPELGWPLADADFWRPFHEVRAGRDAAGDGGADVPDASGDEYEGGPSEDRWTPTEELLPDTDSIGRQGERSGGLLITGSSLGNDPDGCGSPLADPDEPRLEGWGGDRGEVGQGSGERALGQDCVQDTPSEGWRAEGDADARETDGGRAFGGTAGSDWWRVEPDVGRVAHGVPNRVDRLRALGNAVVPQVVEVIGNRLRLLIEDVS